MPNKPNSTVSVLMSVYKSEKPEYLDRSLKSVWTDQLLKPEEIILVQDGPLTSDLDNVIDKWSGVIGDKLVLLKNEQNLGLTKSLNKGLKVAKGEYIARMDTDDISMPERFLHQAAYLDEHPEISVLGGCLQEFDDRNENLNIRHYPLTPEKTRRYICKASPLGHPTVMMRNSIFKEKGLSYNEQYRTSQDIALWFDVLCAGLNIANLDEITLLFRRDSETVRRRSKEKAINEFKIYVNGIKRLNGVLTWKYVYPVMRVILRHMPVGFIKAAYDSPFRRLILGDRKKQ